MADVGRRDGRFSFDRVKTDKLFNSRPVRQAVNTYRFHDQPLRTRLLETAIHYRCWTKKFEASRALLTLIYENFSLGFRQNFSAVKQDLIRSSFQLNPFFQ